MNLSDDTLGDMKKRHSMSFNLNIVAKNNDTVDQTPTPTSFFRNCEEVGLFQDLQNVNPFEETFKKALENSNSKGNSLGNINHISNEDTLHTPHIFPSVEEPLPENIVPINNNSDLPIVSLIEFSQISEKISSQQEPSIQNTTDRQADLKAILKNVLTRRDKIGKNNYIDNNSNINKSQANTKNQSNIERVREINRIAQTKCRIRKKRQMNEMVNELMRLKKENEELKKENLRLKEQNCHLSKALKSAGGTCDEIKTAEIEKTVEKKACPLPSVKKLPMLVPAGSTGFDKNMRPLTPVIFNVVPIQVLSTNPSNASFVSSSDSKRRKIIPRILRKT